MEAGFDFAIDDLQIKLFQEKKGCKTMDPTILIAVAALACPVSMGLLMWIIIRNQGQTQGNMTANTAKPEERLAALQAQREAMNKEIAELEKIKVLEAQRQALEQSKAEPVKSGS
jgi:cell division protein FtsB